MPQQLETVIQDTILGQDCTFSLATSTYTGTVVNMNNVSARFSYRQETFEPAQSAVAGKVLTKEETPSITVSVMAGLNTTRYGFWKNVYGKEITGFDLTDFPSYSEMLARYGKASVTDFAPSYSGGPGMFDITISWATKTHGYSSS